MPFRLSEVPYQWLPLCQSDTNIADYSACFAMKSPAATTPSKLTLSREHALTDRIEWDCHPVTRTVQAGRIRSEYRRRGKGHRHRPTGPQRRGRDRPGEPGASRNRAGRTLGAPFRLCKSERTMEQNKNDRNFEARISYQSSASGRLGIPPEYPPQPAPSLHTDGIIICVPRTSRALNHDDRRPTGASGSRSSSRRTAPASSS